MDLKDYPNFMKRKGGGRILRIDDSLNSEIRTFAKKNQMKIIEATREMASFFREQRNNNKKKKEIIQIIKNVEF